MLDPLLFVLYVAPIANIIASHGINHAQYADDTQLCIAIKGNDIPTAINDCFLALLNWFDMNGLSLNANKLEAVVIGTSARKRHERSPEGLNLADVLIPISDSVVLAKISL